MAGHLRPGHRLFVAYELPEPTRTHLSALTRSVAGEDAAVRVVAPQQLHATVAFIGTLPNDELAPQLIAELFNAMHGPAITTRLGAVRLRPSAARPRLVAIEYDDPEGAAAAHARRIRGVSGRLVGQAGGEDGFWPHITLARVRRPTHLRRFPTEHAEHVFAFDRITLYDSHISSNGPTRYTRLITVPLGTHGERKHHHGQVPGT